MIKQLSNNHSLFLDSAISEPKENFSSTNKHDSLNWLALVDRTAPSSTGRLQGDNAAVGALPDLSLCFVSTSSDQAAWSTVRSKTGGESIVHTRDGLQVEQWLLKREGGQIVSVEPQIGKDSKPDKQGLSDARTQLFKSIEGSNLLEEADKLSLFQSMQKLEQAARDRKLGTEIEVVRTDLASRYLHAARLLAAGAPIDECLQPHSKQSVNYFADCAGNFSDRGERISLVDSEGKVREGRENEIWCARLTKSNDTSFATFSLNGKEIESWQIRTNKGDVLEVKPILHPDPNPDKEGLSESRKQLIAAISRTELSDEEKLEFYKDMAHIEHRARSGEMGLKQESVRTELAETFKHLTRLVSENKDSKVPLKERIIAARQTANQLADTMNVDQGMVSDACRISTCEARLSVVRPSVVARVIADSAINGEVKFGDVLVKLDSESLKPASKFAVQFPKGQNERTFASQLFQLTGMNLLFTDPTVVREHIHYTNLVDDAPKIRTDYQRLVFQQTKEGPRNEKSELYKKNNGMMIYGKSGDKLDLITRPGVLREGANQPLLQACMTQKLLDMLDPGSHEGAVIAHRDLKVYTRDSFDGRSADARGLTLFSNEEELVKLVETAKSKGRLPLILVTRTFDADPGEKEPKLEPDESNHVLTIRDIVSGPKGEKIFVTDDQFGRDYDIRRASMGDIWQMCKPNSQKKDK